MKIDRESDFYKIEIERLKKENKELTDNINMFFQEKKTFSEKDIQSLMSQIKVRDVEIIQLREKLQNRIEKEKLLFENLSRQEELADKYRDQYLIVKDQNENLAQQLDIRDMDIKTMHEKINELKENLHTINLNFDLIVKSRDNWIEYHGVLAKKLRETNDIDSRDSEIKNLKIEINLYRRIIKDIKK